jgi:alkanesulfonate monooxygenase SsuD/methylene tetrahydromethanopterin reductase-like flavin-dependent oxidoreductase (luciferase family)
MSIRTGFYLPNFGLFGDARLLSELAAEAEAAGWDGVFLWDHLQVTEPAVDPWVALAAMALATERLRLGPLVTPVPRRHIAKLAREIVTLDHLTNGRVIFGAGAGYSLLPDYTSFGDAGDARQRAAKLDEGLGVLAQLWSGAAVNFNGEHYQIDTPGFARPVQQPRVPIWTAATHGAARPLARAARWDGLICAAQYGLEVEADDVATMVQRVRQTRADDIPFEVIRFGQTAGPEDTETVTACAQAGVTWWIEYTYPNPTTLEATRARIAQGPPFIAG